MPATSCSTITALGGFDPEFIGYRMVSFALHMLTISPLKFTCILHAPSIIATLGFSPLRDDQ